jgi:hypothetical protein
MVGPLGVMPNEVPVPLGTVPAQKRPFVLSNTAIAKSPAMFARRVHSAAVAVLARVCSAIARTLNAANMSPLFSVDSPWLSGFGGGLRSFAFCHHYKCLGTAFQWLRPGCLVTTSGRCLGVHVTDGRHKAGVGRALPRRLLLFSNLNLPERDTNGTAASTFRRSIPAS